MIAIAHFAGLVLTTLFAAAAAVFLDWLLLRAMFQLMRPAAANAQNSRLQKSGPTTDVAKRTTFGAELAQGTRELVRHLGPAAVRR